MSPQGPATFVTTVNRWYIDTRPYVPQPHNPKSLHELPLLSTVQRSDQEAITRFIRPADRFMSLASALLKYTFIHRRAKIPWSEVQISRTPAPHRRPYWEPPENWSTTDIYDDSDPADDESCRIKGLEFNVSHQAGLVVIIGCSTPTPQLPSSITPNPGPLSPTVLDSLAEIDLARHPTCTAFDHPDLVRLGVDIACTNEDKRTPKDLTTQSKFDEWIEIFAEMFSDRERRHMRQMPIHVPIKEREEGEWGSDSSSSSAASSPTDGPGGGNTKFFQNHEARIINMKLRRFYAYWSLKEAYIKMVGEGLLASWLRELEFLDVHAPPSPPLPKHDGRPSTASNSQPRNSSNTHSIIESQGMPLPASADIYAHRKSLANIPSVPPPVDTSNASGGLAAPATDMFAKRESVGNILTPPGASSDTHRRRSSIPAADMYAQRRPSVASPIEGNKPRKLSIPASAAIAPGSSQGSHARNRSRDYLSPFPDSPSTTPSLLEPPLPAARPSSPNGRGHHPSPVETAKWTPPNQAERGMTTLLRGNRVEDVQIELVAYDQDFMIATAMRGVKERPISGGDGGAGWGEGSGWWLRLDIEEDIRPCAEGWCSCLEE
ncbi:uncharacterized protein Z520_07738 [Fonsecaea multimorphosa CBS 102226]|uniref:holo-[acyl-carrier-protein] synthase n=1 Tax=Fonsecaea multimorphosa CBS 102226 TaxID=1442371 RepID=A0A0D2JSM1_9EURO|nr:uncharacterized protein Z520_07738 [Fonsecaea multimorphosa CBS 102226]KIX96472.1 hypothetical protein Z520_07738 [Fonsecaea multimorphosa CBS 102226]OAL28327.1 hypothetical protein AYO22_03033 [Fonsecaea multimorphosa]